MTIRNMTKEEHRLVFQEGRCPNCRGVEWHAGPCGGACRNYECADCSLGINIVEGMPQLGGQIIREPVGYTPPAELTPPPREAWWRRVCGLWSGLGAAR